MEIRLAKKEEEFPAAVGQGGRVTIPWIYREKLGLEQGTRVRIKIRKDKA
jgi:bifunctional DNA-binding transcriptional regulator/antitoxin component of YhaV-PrlF toxin-antitoxin module